MTFVFSASRSFAATRHDVYIGGVTAGAPLAPGGVVWFNGYSPGTIRITAGDTIKWHLVGGVHTVTSADTLSNGSFTYDSSPLFTPAGPWPTWDRGSSSHQVPCTNSIRAGWPQE